MIVLKVTYFTTQEWWFHSSKLVIVYLKLVQVIELYFQRNYNHAYLRLRQELLSVPMSGNRFEPVSSFLFLCCSPVGILMFETWGWGCKRSSHFFTPAGQFFCFRVLCPKMKSDRTQNISFWRQRPLAQPHGLFLDLTASSTTSRPLTRTYGLLYDLTASGLLHDLTDLHDLMASCLPSQPLEQPHCLLYDLTASCMNSRPLTWPHGLLHDFTASFTTSWALVQTFEILKPGT